MQSPNGNLMAIFYRKIGKSRTQHSACSEYV